MTAKNVKLLAQLENIPVSARTKAELKDLTPSVQQFLIRFMDVRDNDIFDRIAKEIAEPIANINKEFQSISKKLDTIIKKLDDHERRIKCLEDKIKELI